MKPTDFFLVILAAILMALGLRPASASETNVAAVLEQQPAHAHGASAR